MLTLRHIKTDDNGCAVESIVETVSLSKYESFVVTDTGPLIGGSVIVFNSHGKEICRWDFDSDDDLAEGEVRMRVLPGGIPALA